MPPIINVDRSTALEGDPAVRVTPIGGINSESGPATVGFAKVGPTDVDGEAPDSVGRTLAVKSALYGFDEAAVIYRRLRCNASGKLIAASEAEVVTVAGAFTFALVVTNTSELLIGFAKLAWCKLTNNGPGIFYWSHDDPVAVSGINMGHAIYPGGTMELAGYYRLPSGAIRIYGIYSEASAVHNVVISGGGELET